MTLYEIIDNYFEDKESKGKMKELRNNLKKAVTFEERKTIEDQILFACPGIKNLEYPQLYNREEIDNALLKMNNSEKINFINKLLNRWQDNDEYSREYFDKKHFDWGVRLVRCAGGNMGCEFKDKCLAGSSPKLKELYKRKLKELELETSTELDQETKPIVRFDPLESLTEWIKFKNKNSKRNLNQLKDIWNNNSEYYYKYGKTSTLKKYIKEFITNPNPELKDKITLKKITKDHLEYIKS